MYISTVHVLCSRHSKCSAIKDSVEESTVYFLFQQGRWEVLLAGAALRTAAGLMWRRSAWGMTSPNSKTPILFQRLNRHIWHLNALQSVVYWNTLDIVKENTATMGFSCVLFLSMYKCFCFSCVCMHCVYACVCRGRRAQNPSEWNYGQLYAPYTVGASARAANALSLLTCPSLC